MTPTENKIDAGTVRRFLTRSKAGLSPDDRDRPGHVVASVRARYASADHRRKAITGESAAFYRKTAMGDSHSPGPRTLPSSRETVTSSAAFAGSSNHAIASRRIFTSRLVTGAPRVSRMVGSSSPLANILSTCATIVYSPP